MSSDQPVSPLSSSVLVKSLHPGHLPKLLDHFLQLDEDDRYLRFGRPVSDEVIAHYLESIQWESDAVFGVFNADVEIIGVAHLAVRPAADDAVAHVTAEFGVSVLPCARAIGVGGKLFDRAVLHARNHVIETFTMQCLAWNARMMHLATKAGMRVHIDSGEAGATLSLGKPDWRLHIEEAVEEQWATLDLGLKKRVRAANDVLQTLSEAIGRVA